MTVSIRVDTTWSCYLLHDRCSQYSSRKHQTLTSVVRMWAIATPNGDTCASTMELVLLMVVLACFLLSGAHCGHMQQHEMEQKVMAPNQETGPERSSEHTPQSLLSSILELETLKVDFDSGVSWNTSEKSLITSTLRSQYGGQSSELDALRCRCTKSGGKQSLLGSVSDTVDCNCE